MSEQLKPCPFRGSPAELINDGAGGFTVICCHCGIETGLHDGQERAENAWNRRATPSPRKVSVDKVQAEIGAALCQGDDLPTLLKEGLEAAGYEPERGEEIFLHDAALAAIRACGCEPEE